MRSHFLYWFKPLLQRLWTPLSLGTLAIAAIALVGLAPLPGTAQSNSGTELLWYGQSAFKITTPAGHVLLIDPWIENPLNPTAQDDLAALDQVDLILITHGHFDHVGNAAAIAERTGAKLVSTYDLGLALVAYGNYPEELVPFETQGNFGGELSLLDGEVNITFVPAVHSSSVASDGSPANYAGNPGGFLVSIADGPTFYHTGDTDVFADMALIPNFQPVDVMLACIGDKFTMGASRAAEAVKLVNPRMVVPMHYGVFNLPGTPEDFMAAVEALELSTEIKQLAVHEAIAL